MSPVFLPTCKLDVRMGQGILSNTVFTSGVLRGSIAIKLVLAADLLESQRTSVLSLYRICKHAFNSEENMISRTVDLDNGPMSRVPGRMVSRLSCPYNRLSRHWNTYCYQTRHSKAASGRLGREESP